MGGFGVEAASDLAGGGGAAAAGTARPAVGASAGGSADAHSAEGNAGGGGFEAKLKAFYAANQPDKLDNVPKLVAKYAGKEEELWGKLQGKYGTPAVAKALGIAAEAGGGAAPAAAPPAAAIMRLSAPKAPDQIGQTGGGQPSPAEAKPTAAKQVAAKTAVAESKVASPAKAFADPPAASTASPADITLETVLRVALVDPKRKWMMADQPRFMMVMQALAKKTTREGQQQLHALTQDKKGAELLREFAHICSDMNELKATDPAGFDKYCEDIRSAHVALRAQSGAKSGAQRAESGGDGREDGTATEEETGDDGDGGDDRTDDGGPPDEDSRCSTAPSGPENIAGMFSSLGGGGSGAGPGPLLGTGFSMKIPPKATLNKAALSFRASTAPQSFGATTAAAGDAASKAPLAFGGSGGLPGATAGAAPLSWGRFSASAAAPAAPAAPTENHVAALEVLYARHAPTKVAEAAGTVAKFAGREAAMWEELAAKFGPDAVEEARAQAKAEAKAGGKAEASAGAAPAALGATPKPAAPAILAATSTPAAAAAAPAEAPPSRSKTPGDLRRELARLQAEERSVQAKLDALSLAQAPSIAQHPGLALGCSRRAQLAAAPYGGGAEEEDNDLAARLQRMLVGQHPPALNHVVATSEALELLACSLASGDVVALVAGNRLVSCSAREVASGADPAFKPVRVSAAAAPAGAGGGHGDALAVLAGARVTAIGLDETGGCLWLRGPKDLLVVRLLDLETGHLLPVPWRIDAAARPHRLRPPGCPPGLCDGGATVLTDCAWHPLSRRHLAVLTASPPTLRLCRVGDRENGEGGPAGSGDGGGVECAVDLSGLGSPPAALCFGSRSLWSPLTCFVLLESGAVHAVCPLLPDGASLPRGLALDLLGATTDDLAAAWADLSPEEQQEEHRRMCGGGAGSSIAGSSSSSGGGGSSLAEVRALQRRLLWLTRHLGSHAEVWQGSEAQRAHEAAADASRRGHGGGDDEEDEDNDNLSSGFGRLDIAVTTPRRSLGIRGGGGGGSGGAEGLWDGVGDGVALIANRACVIDDVAEGDGPEVERRPIVTPAAPAAASALQASAQASAPGKGAARSLCCVTASGAYRNSALASFPLLVVAYAEGAVEATLALADPAPTWAPARTAGGTACGDGLRWLAHRGRVGEWRDLFQRAARQAGALVGAQAAHGGDAVDARALAAALSGDPALRRACRAAAGLLPAQCRGTSASAAAAQGGDHGAAPGGNAGLEARALFLALSGSLLSYAPRQSIDFVAFGDFLAAQRAAPAWGDLELFRDLCCAAAGVAAAREGREGAMDSGDGGDDGDGGGLLNVAGLRGALEGDCDDEGGAVRLATLLGLPVAAFHQRASSGDEINHRALAASLLRILADGGLDTSYLDAGPDAGLDGSGNGMLDYAEWCRLVGWAQAVHASKWEQLANSFLRRPSEQPLDALVVSPADAKERLADPSRFKETAAAASAVLGLAAGAAAGAATAKEANEVLRGLRDALSRAFERTGGHAMDTVRLGKLLCDVEGLGLCRSPALGAAGGQAAATATFFPSVTGKQPEPAQHKDRHGDIGDGDGSGPGQLLLGRLELRFSGGAAPRLVVDPWAAFPACVVVAHTALVAVVAIGGLDQLERDLNGHDENGDGDGDDLSAGDVAGRFRERLTIDAEVIVASQPVARRSRGAQGGSELVAGRLPSMVVGDGLVGCQVLSAPLLGRLLVCWFGGGGNAVVNLPVLEARLEANAAHRRRSRLSVGAAKPSAEGAAAAAEAALAKRRGGGKVDWARAPPTPAEVSVFLAAEGRVAFRTTADSVLTELADIMSRVPKVMPRASGADGAVPVLRELQAAMDALERGWAELAAHGAVQGRLRARLEAELNRHATATGGGSKISAKEGRPKTTDDFDAADAPAVEMLRRSATLPVRPPRPALLSVPERVAALRARGKATRERARALLSRCLGTVPSLSRAEALYFAELRRSYASLRPLLEAKVFAATERVKQQQQQQQQQITSGSGGGDGLGLPEADWAAVRSVLLATDASLRAARDKSACLTGHLRAAAALPPPRPAAGLVAPAPNAGGDALSPASPFSPARLKHGEKGAPPSRVAFSLPPSPAPTVTHSPFAEEPLASAPAARGAMGVIFDIDVASPKRQPSRRNRRP